MTTRVVVLGAGFGGLELTTLVSQACPDDAVTAIDPSTRRVETTAGPLEADILVVAGT